MLVLSNNASRDRLGFRIAGSPETESACRSEVQAGDWLIAIIDALV